MIYVMSDIHGQLRRFNSVLKQINLRPVDTLYILGDVIDRNPDGIRILRQIMAMPNAKMLLGNHEYMMLEALYYSAPTDDPEEAEFYLERKQDLWYDNGGLVTHRYLKRIPKIRRQEIFRYLDSLPVNMEIIVNGRCFLLTHAAPTELYPYFGYKYRDEKEFAVWKRFETYCELEGKTVIFGHTPTFNMTFESPMEVWNAGSWIGIDCGCMLPETGDAWSGAYGRLACLRLDDMTVFYSEENYPEEESEDGQEPESTSS